MSTTDDEPGGLFRGSELPRLVILVTIALAGWAAVYAFANRANPAAAPPPVVLAGAAPPKVEPDRSPEFESVSDKTPLSFRDNAAYVRLLTESREATPDALANASRRDVLFTHLWERPTNYRGVPVHLLGTARRVLRYESKLSPTGWLYEAWVFTADGQSHPYVCVFEDPPANFPIGPNLSERVVFNGYFLKLMRYEAGDVPRAAPMLVGRLGWNPPEPNSADSPFRTTFWLAAAVALMFAVSLTRWLFQLRRSLSRPRARPAISFRDRPNENIDPETLAQWVEDTAS